MGDIVVNKRYGIVKSSILVIMFYLLIFQNALENYFELFGILDESISLIFLLYGVYRITFNRKKAKINKNNIQIIVCLIIIGIIGLAGNILYKYQDTVPLIKDGVSVFKGMITYVCIPIIFLDFKISDYLEIINKHIKIISVGILTLV